jgi:hypothetical protein
MAIDPEGTVRLQEQFARGLAHMVEHPVDALGNMIDTKDLQSGDYAKWLGHLTPDVIVTVLTMGGGGAAATAGEGVARTAAETTAEQVAKTVAEDASKTAAEHAGFAGAGAAAVPRSADAIGRASRDAAEQAGKAADMGGAEAVSEPLPGGAMRADRDPRIRELFREHGETESTKATSPSAARSAMSARNLARQLASEQQIGEQGGRISGVGSKVPLRAAPRFAQMYGGMPENWAKFSSSSYLGEDGFRFEIHWYENLMTGERVEFKTKLAHLSPGGAG